MRRFATIASALIHTILATAALASQSDASTRIDQILAEKHAATNTAANPPASDEVFLRRIYLDVVGRIPTVEESRRFLDSSDADKRSKLIDDLLAAEGAVSHSFNYWADILRISELIGNNRLTTYGYSFWLKDALRKNLPYDEMVRQMITARGFIWENGATGYYHRDRGMPLDNMSNTIRVFLGTRLECAQCHDHPFDQWTQMDYYKMAALSYSMDARLWLPPGRKAIAEFQANFVEQAQARSPNGRLESGSPDYLRYRAINQVNADLFAFMKFVLTRETPQTLTLPHDYQYDDAKPEDPVAPATMFGGEIEADSLENLIDAYGAWMTSPDNPRFTRVIANRLWKRAMGRGLIEPVDEFMDHSVAAVPELLDYLSERMVELDYDMRAFQREIYNSRAYQREATTAEVQAGEAYLFPGPLLRRLSAEQIWDSLVTLSIPNPDYFMPQMDMRLGHLDRLRQIYTSFESRSEEEIVDLARNYSDRYAESYQRVRDLTAARLAAIEDGDDEKAAELGKELNGIRNQERAFMRKMAHGDKVNNGRARDVYANFGIGGELLPLEKVTRTQPRPKTRQGSDEQFTAWRELSAAFMRASELPFPAPRGHFLRDFGQSDRENIQNASDSASVPQALELLNGPFAEALANPNAVLQMDLAGVESSAEKIETLFLATLGRRPTDQELTLFQEEIESQGDPAYDTILWVLLNSQQFRFLN